MMRRFHSALYAVGGAFAFAVTAVAAPMTAEEYQTKLKAYDSAAVEAATHYAKTFNIMDGFVKTAPRMAENLKKQLKDKNPDISDDQIKEFVDTFEHVALVDDAEVIDHAVVLALLDTFSAEEIVALEKFYSTPVGQSILKKFPAIGQKLLEARKLMPTEIVPKAMEAAKAKLKADGIDVKM
jgi:hypothetical protein